MNDLATASLAFGLTAGTLALYWLRLQAQARRLEQTARDGKGKGSP